jgi:hypothetical protein
MISIETGNEVVWEEEVNWKFRLGAFKDRLLAWAGDPKCERSRPLVDASVCKHAYTHNLSLRLSRFIFLFLPDR